MNYVCYTPSMKKTLLIAVVSILIGVGVNSISANPQPNSVEPVPENKTLQVPDPTVSAPEPVQAPEVVEVEQTTPPVQTPVVQPENTPEPQPEPTVEPEPEPQPQTPVNRSTFCRNDGVTPVCYPASSSEL